MNSHGDPREPLSKWALDAGLERYVPKKGWGYSVVARTWYEDTYQRVEPSMPSFAKQAMYEVCPFYDGDTVLGMDVLVCLTIPEVARAIDLIMDGNAPLLYPKGEEE